MDKPTIFPADAGVNLLKEGNIPSEIHIPRGCGGEPKELVEQARLNTIFPADAGVNLITSDLEAAKKYIPRGCGGEP